MNVLTMMSESASDKNSVDDMGSLLRAPGQHASTNKQFQFQFETGNLKSFTRTALDIR